MRRLVSIAAVLALAGCTPSPPPTAPPTPSAPPVAPVAVKSAVPGGCGDSPVWTGGLPEWTASANAPSTRFVLSHEENLVGVLFAFPLRAQPDPQGPNNKILWIVREPRHGTPLRLTLHPMGSTGPTVEQEQPANSSPGEIYPSIVDVKGAGCWSVTARWAGKTATLELAYI